ncbi:MAG: peptide deformylase [Acidaminococcaceae bacterium]|nr:peptide deformylase [Acidaminococcaceae bacterium]
MAVLKICTAGNPVLKQVAKPVEKIDKRLTRLLNNMVETMYAAEGVGLAAPQVGESRRVVVIDVGDGVVYEMINPVITKKEGTYLSTEGCLSVPEYSGEVERAAYVECEYTNRQGERMLVQARELLAVCIQHELDHLDGVLFIEKAKSLTVKKDTEE